MKQKLTLFILFVLTVNIKAGIGVGYSNPAPLPVELTTFTVNLTSNTVELNWETATEVNNYGFEILRSVRNDSHSAEGIDEESWEKIGFVNGHGNSNSPKYYSFTDSKNKLSGKVLYRLKQIDIDGKFTYSDAIEMKFELPLEFNLAQNYPNPFNPTTVISYSIPEAANVNITVYDVLGTKIATLVNGNKQAGNYNTSFDASSLSNGVYFYKIEVGSYSAIKKMILLK